MESIRKELIDDLGLDTARACPRCIIEECPAGKCEWEDDSGGISDEPHHREKILDACYRVGGFSLWKKWRIKLRFGLDIDEMDDYPELSTRIDHCLWHHEDANRFEEIIRYCVENEYDISESVYIHDPFYLDDAKIQVLRNYQLPIPL